MSRDIYIYFDNSLTSVYIIKEGGSMDTLTTQIYIGRKIHALRAMRGMSQVALSQAAQLGQRYISRYENGQWHAIHPDHLLRLAQALGCSIDELMGRGHDGR